MASCDGYNGIGGECCCWWSHSEHRVVGCRVVTNSRGIAAGVIVTISCICLVLHPSTDTSIARRGMFFKAQSVHPASKIIVSRENKLTSDFGDGQSVFSMLGNETSNRLSYPAIESATRYSGRFFPVHFALKSRKYRYLCWGRTPLISNELEAAGTPGKLLVRG